MPDLTVNSLPCFLRGISIIEINVPVTILKGMGTPREARPTHRFIDEYSELYADLFPAVLSFEAFKIRISQHISPICFGSNWSGGVSHHLETMGVKQKLHYEKPGKPKGGTEPSRITYHPQTALTLNSTVCLINGLSGFPQVVEMT